MTVQQKYRAALDLVSRWKLRYEDEHRKNHLLRMKVWALQAKVRHLEESRALWRGRCVEAGIKRRSPRKAA